MPLLTIRHYEADGVRMVDLVRDGHPITMSFDPELERFDLEELRWYYENYRRSWTVTSEPAVARIRRAQRKVGEALHAALFAGAALPLAAEVRRAGSDLRVEIRDEAHDAAIPWELIADPVTEEPLALRASSFVRTVGEVTTVPVNGGVRRVLLLISRPHGVADIGYWAVAYELWRQLSATRSVTVEVLRPPTFKALDDRLREAAAEGAPYTVVHFDGHGVILNPFGGAMHTGYLVFETAEQARPDFVDGSTLGRALASAGVLLLSMNACRSADSAGDQHLRAAPEEKGGQPSVVEEVLAEGVPACIGMGREVYPGTPSRFFGAFYAAFFDGSSPGEAAQLGRARLRAEPLTAGTFREKSTPIDDWSIPVVGERAIIRLPTQRTDGRSQAQEDVLLGPFPQRLLAPPVVGFDTAILILEALLAEASIILVHGPVLAGKSRLAVEYGRWLADTSPTPGPVAYIDLSDTDAPGEIAQRMPDDLHERGGLLILDQADHVGPEAQEFLINTLAQLDGVCQVIVTARSPNLPWLPAHERITPDLLPLSRRAELGNVWARDTGVEFDARRFHPLVFFSGGYPGVLLLLLGVSHDLINRGEATADEVVRWLTEAVWADIARLGTAPVRVENMVNRLVADLSSHLHSDELAMIPYVARFNVCCDAAAMARLTAAATGTDVPEEVAAGVIAQLLAAGLVRDSGATRPGWFLHPLLKVVASRLPTDPIPDLDDVLIVTTAEVCTELSASFRSETAEVLEMIMLHQQNMHDALWLALERGRLEAAAKLTEAICLFCRYEGDVELSGRVLDKVLPYFIDTSTGALLPENREIGLRVWDQAIWVGPDWPRNRIPTRQGQVRLQPPDGDHYAAGLFFRAIGRFDLASHAFLAELRTQANASRYSPGDIQWYLTELNFSVDPSKDFRVELEGSLRSHAARHTDDAIGRASSRILEARIRVTRASDQLDPTRRLAPRPEELDEIAALLRDALSEPGGESAENLAQAGMLWSTIMLWRGDLTSAVRYFEAGATIVLALQESAIWRAYWFFARSLVDHGWVAKGYEMAQTAFGFAMQTGDIEIPTTIRKFCERLKATHPELNS